MTRWKTATQFIRDREQGDVKILSGGHRVFRNAKAAAEWSRKMQRQGQTREARESLEAEEREEVARDLIGDLGHYITELDPGRFGVFDSDGVCHAIVRGKEAAEAAATQLATTGKITR